MDINIRAQERAAKKYIVVGDCWETTYSVGSHGYGQVGWSVKGKNYGTTTHRAAWTFYNGPIPDGMTIDHICHNRKCVNPSHLQLLTNLENARKNRPDYNPEYCKRGHKRRSKDIGARKGCYTCNLEHRRWWYRNNVSTANYRK